MNDSRLAGRGRQIVGGASAGAGALHDLRTAELVMPLVIKGDRAREAFDEAKLRAGMAKALESAPFHQADHAAVSACHQYAALGDRKISARAVEARHDCGT